MYYLTDGMYPEWKVLIQTIPEPLGCKQKLYAKLQEGQHKDVKQAFGVLQVSLADWCFSFILHSHYCFLLSLVLVVNSCSPMQDME